MKVTRAQLQEACRALGLDPNEVAHLNIGPNGGTVEKVRRDAHGLTIFSNARYDVSTRTISVTVEEAAATTGRLA